MQRLLCYLMLSLLIFLPTSGQAASAGVAETDVVLAMHTDTPDCMTHQSHDMSGSKAHAGHATAKMTTGDCCQNDAEHACGQQDSGCAQTSCQCEHTSSHLVSYLAGTKAPFITKVTPVHITNKPVVVFSGFPTSLLRPPITLS